MRVNVREGAGDLDKCVQDFRLEKRFVELAATVKTVLQRPTFRILLHNVQATAAKEGPNKSNDMRMTIQHHQDFHLAQYLRGSGLGQTLERNIFAAQHVPIGLAPHHAGRTMSPLPKDVKRVKIIRRAAAAAS